MVTKSHIHVLKKPAAFNTIFVTTRHYKANEKQAVKGERYSEK